MIDVLVVGAGPTGLLMAAELSRYGLRCRLIEKGVSYRDETRAAAIQPRTLEIFAHLGIEGPFLAQGLQVIAMNPMSGREKLARFSFSVVDSPYRFILSLQQQKTEAILTAYAASFGVAVERGVELVDLEQGASSVRARLLHEGREEMIEARWLVGCDGAHSKVRKLLSLPFEGKPFREVFSLADVRVDWGFPHNEAFAFLNAKGVLAAIPLPEPNRYRLIFSQHEKNAQEPTLPQVQALLTSYVDQSARVSDPRWMANFHIHTRMSSTFQRGRVFIAGDAAHIHSPVGGQGMNTGLQDAFNLAWKIAYVQTGKADPSLLDTYTEERRSFAKTLLFATARSSSLVTLRHPFLIWLRNRVVKWLSHWGTFRKKLPNIVSQIKIRYRKNRWICEDHPPFGGPKVGTRAPNAPVGNTDLYSLWKKTTKFHMLVFGDFEEDVSTLTNGLLAVHSIKDREACRIYSAPSVYIIRPDTYIGYRSRKLVSAEILLYMKKMS